MINYYIGISVYLILIFFLIGSRIYYNKKVKLDNIVYLIYNKDSKLLHYFYLFIFVIVFASFTFEIIFKIVRNEQFILDEFFWIFFILTCFAFDFAFRYKDPVVLNKNFILTHSFKLKMERIKFYQFEKHKFSNNRKCVIFYNLPFNITFSFTIRHLNNLQVEKIERFFKKYLN